MTADFREVLRRDPFEGAASLLGAVLRKGELSARIVEVEVYLGAEDPGSHAHRGRTPRNGVLFGPPGIAYVYFNYGMYWLLNISALEDGVPSAILIRAGRPLTGVDEMRLNRPTARRETDLLSGPGKLCQAFGIDGTYNGVDLLDPASPVHLEPGEPVTEMIVTRRIGLAVGKGEEKEWRFVEAAEARWASPHPRSV